MVGEWKKEAPDGRKVAERKCQALTFFSKSIRINERQKCVRKGFENLMPDLGYLLEHL